MGLFSSNNTKRVEEVAERVDERVTRFLSEAEVASVCRKEMHVMKFLARCRPFSAVCGAKLLLLSIGLRSSKEFGWLRMKGPRPEGRFPSTLLSTYERQCIKGRERMQDVVQFMAVWHRHDKMYVHNTVHRPSPETNVS